MSKFWRRGKMATKLAMTCLSHMVLSPVGLRQIGNECQHMASAALCLHVRVCCLHHHSPPCLAIFSYYTIPHSVPTVCLAYSPTASFLNLSFLSDLNHFLKAFIPIIFFLALWFPCLSSPVSCIQISPPPH